MSGFLKFFESLFRKLLEVGWLFLEDIFAKLSNNLKLPDLNIIPKKWVL